MKTKLTALLLAFCTFAASGFATGISAYADDFGADLASFKKDQNIEEAVLYDENSVRITATGITYANYEAQLGIRIENNTEKNLEFHAETYGYSCNAVNGFMIESGYIGMELSPGESGEDTADFGYGELLLHGINQIADIQIGFDIRDDDSNHIYTGPMKVSTPLAESYAYDSDSYQKAITSKALQYTYGYTVEDFDASEIYNSGGIRILSKCHMTNEDGEHSLFLEVKNDNDFPVQLTAGEITFNGIEVYDSTWSYRAVNPFCRTLITLRMDDIADESEREALGIDEVESIGFTIKAGNEDGIVIAEPKALDISL